MPAAARIAAVVAAIAIVATIVVVVLNRFDVVEEFDAEYCEAKVGGDVARLELDQAENAALIAAIGVRRDLPARAVSIALATAFQESKIRNLDYGDRDSVGIFQQRPSQGWGSAEEIQDPVYATETFFDALEQVDGYEDMPIHDAAQAVQRSADGSAYAMHETPARVLASALTGWSPAAFQCEIDEPGSSEQRAGSDGLTRNARAVVDDAQVAFGALGSSAGKTGRTVRLDPPVDGSRRHGWALAQYLVGQADRLGIKAVAFDGRVWIAAQSGDGWQRGGRRLDEIRVRVA